MSFISNLIYHVLNEMDKLFDSSSETEIESLVSNFTNVMVNSSKKVVCVRNGQVSRKKQRNTFQTQEWFDRNCHSFKKELQNLGYLLFTTKKDYKRLVKRLKRNFQNGMLEKIPFMEENNPKEFWKLVNSIKSRQSESV